MIADTASRASVEAARRVTVGFDTTCVEIPSTTNTRVEVARARVGRVFCGPFRCIS